MPESSRALLRRLFMDDYATLAVRLTRRVGSAELAADALQETFLRLEQGADIGPVRNPRAYLLLMATNIARSKQRAERRRLTVSEGDEFLNLIDEAPSPERIAEGKSDLAALSRALSDMPARRRAIFIAAWSEGVSNEEIAKRHRITLRTVQLELRHATEHCAERLARSRDGDFAGGRRGTSSG